MERLEKQELALEDQRPQGNADAALGDELVGRRGGDHGRPVGAAAPAAIAFAMIAATMGANVDFEDVAIGRARNFLQRFAALGATFVLLGQIANFVGGGQMIVIASAMPFAASLLAALARWLVVVGIVGIGFRLRGGGGFGFSPEEPAFPFTDFPLELLHLGREIRLALDGALVHRLPIVGLAAQVDELAPQLVDRQQGNPKEENQLAETMPQKSKRVRGRLVLRIRIDNEARRNRDKRTLLRRKENQGIGGVTVHAPKWYATGSVPT